MSIAIADFTCPDCGYFCTTEPTAFTGVEYYCVNCDTKLEETNVRNL